jgi:hypothetical protein
MRCRNALNTNFALGLGDKTTELCMLLGQTELLAVQQLFVEFSHGAFDYLLPFEIVVHQSRNDCHAAANKNARISVISGIWV